MLGKNYLGIGNNAPPPEYKFRESTGENTEFLFGPCKCQELLWVSGWYMQFQDESNNKKWTMQLYGKFELFCYPVTMRVRKGIDISTGQDPADPKDTDPSIWRHFSGFVTCAEVGECNNCFLDCDDCHFHTQYVLPGVFENSACWPGRGWSIGTIFQPDCDYGIWRAMEGLLRGPSADCPNNLEVNCKFKPN